MSIRYDFKNSPYSQFRPFFSQVFIFTNDEATYTILTGKLTIDSDLGKNLEVGRYFCYVTGKVIRNYKSKGWGWFPQSGRTPQFLRARAGIDSHKVIESPGF